MRIRLLVFISALAVRRAIALPISNQTPAFDAVGNQITDWGADYPTGAGRRSILYPVSRREALDHSQSVDVEQPSVPEWGRFSRRHEEAISQQKRVIAGSGDCSTCVRNHAPQAARPILARYPESLHHVRYFCGTCLIRRVFGFGFSKRTEDKGGGKMEERNIAGELVVKDRAEKREDPELKREYYGTCLLRRLLRLGARIEDNQGSVTPDKNVSGTWFVRKRDSGGHLVERLEPHDGAPAPIPRGVGLGAIKSKSKRMERANALPSNPNSEDAEGMQRADKRQSAGAVGAKRDSGNSESMRGYIATNRRGFITVDKKEEIGVGKDRFDKNGNVERKESGWNK